MKGASLEGEGPAGSPVLWWGWLPWAIHQSGVLVAACGSSASSDPRSGREWLWVARWRRLVEASGVMLCRTVACTASNPPYHLTSYSTSTSRPLPLSGIDASRLFLRGRSLLWAILGVAELLMGPRVGRVVGR